MTLDTEIEDGAAGVVFARGRKDKKTPPPLSILDRLITTDRELNIPLHVQVKRALKTVIERDFEDGQRFWTEAALSQHMKVAAVTVRRALSDLAREGLLERKVSQGTAVRKATVSALDFTHNGEQTSQSFNRLEASPKEERVVVVGNPSDTCYELGTALAARGYRFAMVNTTHSGVQAAYVGIDEMTSLEKSIDYLMSLGHRNIALLVNEPYTSASVVRRMASLDEITARRSLTGSRLINCLTNEWEDSYAAAYDKMPDLWSSSPAPTAIIAVSAAGAYGALKWFRQRGISVPDQCSVMGLTDAEPGEFMTPSVTALASMSVVHVQMAMEILEADPDPTVVRLSHPDLIVRESTGLAPQDQNAMPQ